MKHMQAEIARARIMQCMAYLRKRSFISRRIIIIAVMIMPAMKSPPKIAFTVNNISARSILKDYKFSSSSSFVFKPMIEVAS